MRILSVTRELFNELLSSYDSISLNDWKSFGASNNISPQFSGHLIHKTPAKSDAG